MSESHAPISDAADQGTGTPSDPALSVSMEQGVILVATEEAAPLNVLESVQKITYANIDI